MGGLISGLLGGGSSPGQEAQMNAIKASREDIQRYRPEAMQAALNAFSQAASAYQPMNNMLETMYGGGPKAPVGGPYRPMPRTPQGPAPQLPQGPAPGGQRPGAPRDPYSGNMAAQLLDPAGLFKGFF